MKRRKSADLNVGDWVVVKARVRDPDFNCDIGGWQGSVVEVGRGDGGTTLLRIRWDRLTLNTMDPELIARCEEEGLDWTQMDLESHEVEPAAPRGTEDDVVRTVHEMSHHHRWAYLGEAGTRIQKVLAAVDAGDVMAALRAWEEYVEEHLTFPFEAVVSESQGRGPLQAGDRVRLTNISLVDDLYGIIVHLSAKRRGYDFPLCDLEATDKRSPNYQIVADYRAWFANR